MSQLPGSPMDDIRKRLEGNRIPIPGPVPTGPMLPDLGVQTTAPVRNDMARSVGRVDVTPGVPVRRKVGPRMLRPGGRQVLPERVYRTPAVRVLAHDDND